MKDDWFEKIEVYLNGNMSPDEKLRFEAELSSNEELMSLLKVYTAIETEMRGNEKFSADEKALKETLGRLNTRYFERRATDASASPGTTDNLTTAIKPAVDQSAKTTKIIPITNRKLYTIIASIAASMAILAIAYFIFLGKEEPQRLANEYVEEHLLQLSQTMDPAPNTFQQAISTYNNREYVKALGLFQEVYSKDPNNVDAKKNIGLVYLVMKDYGKALQHFDELSKVEGLYSNPGMFLKALTLLQRNEGDDKQEAKKLLLKIVDAKAEGSAQAREWLDKL